jgi:hypothetical protein
MTDDERHLDECPRCANCGQEIREHCRDSDPPWRCPDEYQREAVYGYFHGGDPRNFSPDAECCSPEELARHKAACAEAEEIESARDLPCPSGWEWLPGGGIAHTLRAPFGIGVYRCPTIYYEPGFGHVPADGQQELFTED